MAPEKIGAEKRLFRYTLHTVGILVADIYGPSVPIMLGLSGKPKSADGKSELEISLKYYAGRPVIERIERVSRPGLRVYRGRNAIPQVQNGLGVAIVTTPQGVMTDRKARATGVGGEVLCYVA